MTDILLAALGAVLAVVGLAVIITLGLAIVILDLLDGCD